MTNKKLRRICNYFFSDGKVEGNVFPTQWNLIYICLHLIYIKSRKCIPSPTKYLCVERSHAGQPLFTWIYFWGETWVQQQETEQPLNMQRINGSWLLKRIMGDYLLLLKGVILIASPGKTSSGSWICGFSSTINGSPHFSLIVCSVSPSRTT